MQTQTKILEIIYLNNKEVRQGNRDFGRNWDLQVERRCKIEGDHRRTQGTGLTPDESWGGTQGVSSYRQSWEPTGLQLRQSWGGSVSPGRSTTIELLTAPYKSPGCLMSTRCCRWICSSSPVKIFSETDASLGTVKTQSLTEPNTLRYMQWQMQGKVFLQCIDSGEVNTNVLI